VLSQVGPLVRMAPANLMRAYLMRFFKAHFSFGEFKFRSNPTSQQDALIDRALATLPYPKNEFRIENPRRPCKRTGWVGARHRMDALYGRVFKLDNMSEEALDHIDDFFGPFNVDTVSQVLHFARSNTVTDRRGDNVYVSPARLERYMNFPILALHGRHNGLADVATNILLRSAFGHRKNFEHEVFDDFGHQDCLIGRDCSRVFERISKFFLQP
jgi:cholesterol oxidase